jgi:hypothetical protein
LFMNVIEPFCAPVYHNVAFALKAIRNSLANWLDPELRRQGTTNVSFGCPKVFVACAASWTGQPLLRTSKVLLYSTSHSPTTIVRLTMSFGIVDVPGTLANAEEEPSKPSYCCAMDVPAQVSSLKCFHLVSSSAKAQIAPMVSKAEPNSLDTACWGSELRCAKVATELTALLCTRVTETWSASPGMQDVTPDSVFDEMLQRLNNDFYSALLQFLKQGGQCCTASLSAAVPDCNDAIADESFEATGQVAVVPEGGVEHAVHIVREHLPCISMSGYLCHKIMRGLAKVHGISTRDMARARNILVKQGVLVYSGRTQRKMVLVKRAKGRAARRAALFPDVCNFVVSPMVDPCVHSGMAA